MSYDLSDDTELTPQEIAELEQKALAGDAEAKMWFDRLARGKRTAENLIESLPQDEQRKRGLAKVGGSDKGIGNRLDRAIERVQLETGNRMSPELAEHYRAAVVKKRRRTKDRIARRSRKRNRR